MLLLFIVIFTSMSVSALCSILEATLLSISSVEIAEISTKKQRISSLWNGFKADIQKPIAIILILNTIAHTMGAAISGAQFNRIFGSGYIIAFSLAFSFAMILWTEILPKTLGVKYNKKIALMTAVPLRTLIYILSPLLWLIEILNRPFVGKQKDKNKLETVKELSILTRFAFINKLISRDQEQIISRTIGIAEKKARDIMIPVSEIKVLTTGMSLHEALIEAHIHNHTRYPLIDRKRKNEIIGYVNFKDLVSVLTINPANPSLKGIKRPVISIFDDEDYSTVFKKMTALRQHIAVVKNRKKKIVGLLTLEDVLEEIVGEIEDEYDILPDHFYQLTANRYVSGGGILIKRINKTFSIQLPDAELTVSDWMDKNFTRSLKSGEKLVYDTVTFIVRKIRRSHVYEIIVEVK